MYLTRVKCGTEVFWNIFNNRVYLQRLPLGLGHLDDRVHQADAHDERVHPEYVFFGHEIDEGLVGSAADERK